MTLALAARPLPVSLRRLATPDVGHRILMGSTIAVVAALGLWTAIGIGLRGGDLMLLVVAGSVPVSCAAVLVVGRHPALAGVLAAAPYGWLLVDSRWLGF